MGGATVTGEVALTDGAAAVRRAAIAGEPGAVPPLKLVLASRQDQQAGRLCSPEPDVALPVPMLFRGWERVTRLELATSSLARRCSTTELHPQPAEFGGQQ